MLSLLLTSFLWDPAAAQSCLAELQMRHAVRCPRGAFAPLYQDLELAAYLTALGARTTAEPVAVLPFLSPAPLCFAQDNRLFISTARLLQFQSEEHLAEALAAHIAAAKRRLGKRPAPASVCARLAPAGVASFDQIRSTLQKQLAEYEEWTRPRLKPRPSSTGPGERKTTGGSERDPTATRSRSP